MERKIVLCFACFVPLAFCWVKQYTVKYQPVTSSRLIPTRLLSLMQTYTEEGWRRMQETNEMRFMYEESPHYEFGYVTADIIERYRKMVEHVRMPIQMQSLTLFDVMKRTELIQKLYFEVYHLVKMAHEIIGKYKSSPEFNDLEKPPNLKQIFQEKQDQKIQEKIEKQERKKKEKFVKKFKDMISKGKLKDTKIGKAYNKWWPIDYGWEIDYYW